MDLTLIQKHLTGIKFLTYSNYSSGKMKLHIVLCCPDYNFVLTEDKPIIDPTTIDAQKAVTQVFIDKWVKANKMSILIIKCSIDPIMFGGISKKESTKDLFAVIKY